MFTWSCDQLYKPGTRKMEAMAIQQVEDSCTTVEQFANEIKEYYAARLKRNVSDERRNESGAFKISTFTELFYGTVPENDQHTIQNVPDERRNESGAKKIWTFAELLYGTAPENEQHVIQNMSDKRRNESGANKISAFTEQTDDISPNNSSKKRSIFALLSQSLPCAGGSDLEDSQHKQQAASDIYQHTLRTVSRCPNVSDYLQRATDKCAEVCKNNIQDGGCSYHCMRDSYKTSLVEFCAKPKLLFGYCPEYDPIGRTIQKDIFTRCKPSYPSQEFYRSSDLFFCDRDVCQQLREAGVNTGLTNLMTDATPVSRDINDTWLSQYWYIVLLLGVALISCCALACVFRLRRRFTVFRKRTKKGNPDDVQNNNEQAVLHNAI